MTTKNRDDYICCDYKDGKEISELARSYGISERRVAQILRKHCVTLRNRPQTKKKALSAEHVRIGLHLYQYRFEKGFDPHDAALKLGWSMLKVRKVERGITDLELLDLLDIADFTETEFSKLLS